MVDGVVWKVPAAFQPLAVGPEGELYVTGENGEFRSLGPDGTERWVTDLGPGIGIYNASLASNDLLHVSTKGARPLLMLRASDGSFIGWRQSETGGINEAVAVMTETGPSGDLYTISEDGLLVRYPSEDGPRLWNLRVGQKVTAPPIVGPDGTVYVGTVDPGAIHAISPDGVELWREEIGPVEVSPAAGSVYVATVDGFLYAFDQDGSFRWDQDILSPPLAPPVIFPDGGIYVLSADGLFLFNDFGVLKWSAQVGPPAQDGLVLDPNGTAYVLSQEGTVWAVDRDGNVNEFFRDPNATWVATSPQGLLYVGGFDGLTALKPVAVEKPIAFPPATTTPFRPALPPAATARPAPTATPTPFRPALPPAATARPAPTATPTPVSPELEYGGVLRLAMRTDPFAGGLYPYENIFSNKASVNSLIFSRLFRHDPVTSEIVGDLVEGWEVSSNSTAWTLRLRSDARLPRRQSGHGYRCSCLVEEHDGRPVLGVLRKP